MWYLLIDIPHFILLFYPILLLALPKQLITRSFIWPTFIFMATPISWNLFNNLCPLTVLSQKLGGMQNTVTNSGFSETYLKWLYNPFIKLWGGKWNEKNINFMSSVHWLANYFIIWYIIFYSGSKIC